MFSTLFIYLDTKQLNFICKIVSQLMIQHLDRLALTNVLSGKKTSWIGLCGTLIVLAVCLALYVPAIQRYLERNYYQSQFMTYQNHTGYIYSKEDFKIALVVKDKLTGKPYNHTEILNTLDVQVKGQAKDGTYNQLLQPCDNNYFVGDINGEYLQDCMIVPNQIGFDVEIDSYEWAYLTVVVRTPYVDVPFAQYSTPLTIPQMYYNKLSANSYIQFYFTSKVVTPSNEVKFQVHSFYTTEFTSSNTSLWTSFNVNQGFKLTMIDDSIFPWRNNRNVSTLSWNGEQIFVASTNTLFGIKFDDSHVVAVRYYKKLDWLIGIIGGGMFFVFIVFWSIFNPINRWLQRIELPSKFFLRQSTIEYPQSDQDLSPLKVSPLFLIRNLWLFCKDKKTLRILAASEHQNDIVLLLKKLKVATRNLERKELIVQFTAKFIAFPGDDVNALNRFLKGNSDGESYGSQIQSQVSSKSESKNSSVSKSKSKSSKKSEKPVQQQLFIPMDSRSQFNQIVVQRNQAHQNQEQPRAILLSSQNGEDQIDGFQFINDGEIAQQMLQKVQSGIKLNEQQQTPQPSKQKQQQIKLPLKESVQKQQQIVKEPEQEVFRIPILQIKEEDNPVIENHITLTNMPFNQPVPPIIIIQNDKAIAIIPSNQLINSQPAVPAYFTQQVQPAYFNQQISQVNQNQQHMIHNEHIPVEQLSPERRSQVQEQNAQKQKQIVVQQQNVRDEKFNLNSEQLLILRENKEMQQLMATNPTYWTFKEEKPKHFQNLMEINQYDHYQGHFQNKRIKCKTMLANKIAAFFRWLDVFWVRVSFQQRQSGSMFGIFLTFLLIAASILTFALTINNMSNYHYKIDKQYLQPKDISFSGYTGENLNIVVCPYDTTYFIDSTKLFNLNYFVNVNGNVTLISPVQMGYDDNTFNIYGNKVWSEYTSDCFKMPPNVPIILNSTSYFGYTINTYCPGTSAACKAAMPTFVSQASSTFFNTYMPSNTIEFNSTSLISSVSKKRSQTFGQIAFTLNTVYQQTILADIVELKDDSGNQFMGQPPKTIQSNINVGTQSAKQLIKASNGSAPSYTFALKPSQSKTVYTLSQRKLSFIVSIIGGVFVFWYAIISSLAYLYNKFHFHMFVAKEIYEQQGYDNFVLTKLVAALRFPPCLLPKCCDIREDIQRMQGVSTKIDKSLNLPSLIKYIDNVYRLSTSFFETLPLKQLALLHFKEKIDEASKVVQIVKVKQSQEPQFMSVYDQGQDKSKDNEALIGKIANQTKMSFFQNLEDAYNKEVQAQVQENIIEIERYNQNIFEDPKPSCSDIPDMFDMFEEPASFTFKQSRKIQSCFGGLLTLIMLGMIVIVVIHPVLQYFTSAGRDVSYETKIDEDTTSSNNGLTLITGNNFKLGVTALNATSMLPGNITSYIKSTVGISLLVKTTNKTNGVLTQAQNAIDLIPCPLNYLTSWLSPTAVSPVDNFQNAYCVPDGLVLQISGIATDLIRRYFKLSIYDKSNSATGYKNLIYLMGNYTFQIHYSSPERNYVDQSMRYYVWSTILDLPGKTHVALATQRNMTLSKVNISYDGDSNQWQKDRLTQISYVYDDFVTEQMNYGYFIANTTNIWYNISFALNKKVYLYSVTTPKFYEVWGLVGGVIAFFFFIANCLGASFNNYKMRYLIGRQLYNFDRLKDGNLKIKRKKVDKEMFHEINNYSEGKILLAFFLSVIARIIRDYQFNDTLRRITLIQKKVKEDLDIIDFYRKLYIARESISKQLQKKHHIFRRIKPTDIYLKHIYNPSPLEYNYTDLINYAKQNNLSSFQQRIVLDAKKARVNIREVFDGKFLAKIFGLQDDNRSAHLNDMRETIGSFNSSSGGGSFGPSVGEPSVNLN